MWISFLLLHNFHKLSDLKQHPFTNSSVGYKPRCSVAGFSAQCLKGQNQRVDWVRIWGL